MIIFFKKYYQLLFENKLQLNDYRLQCFVPLKLQEGGYILCNVCVIPIIKKHTVQGFYFALTPLKEYANDFPTFNILKEKKKDTLLTYQINSMVVIDDLLTKKQSEIFDLILRGFSSTEIAKQIDKKKETVFSYNIRIKEKLIEFFEIDFENVVDAVKYYQNCFLN